MVSPDSRNGSPFSKVQLYRNKVVQQEMRFKDIKPLRQFLMVRTFINQFHNITGLRLNYNKVIEVFCEVNPQTIDGKLSIYGYVPVQRAIIDHFYCGISSALQHILK